MNQDLTNDSVTKGEVDIIFRALTKEHAIEPGTSNLTIFFFASHGIDRNANQQIVLNEFDKKASFYSLLNSEEKIRVLSEYMKNGYFISIFACCREFFKHDVHCGCVGAKSKEEAEGKINKREQE